MSYAAKKISEYLEEAGSNSPTPGGGSVSALVGALGVAMGRMAANFTVGRKKFKDVEPRVVEILNKLDEGLAALVKAMDDDAVGYAELSAAYKMPRGTEEEKKTREKAIQNSLHVAIKPPLEVCRLAYGMLKNVAELGKIANPNLLSDVAVAAILLHSALRGAKMNVLVNLACLDDEQTVDEIKEEIDELENLATISCTGTVKTIEDSISAG